MTHLQSPRTKLPMIVLLVAVVAWFSDTARADDPVRGAPFNAVLDATSAAASTEKPNPAYNHIPLTVELWARLDAKEDYNILVANQLKASPTHWEVYTERGAGTYSAYLPGCSPSIIRSPTVLTDGRWHYLAMIFDGHAVRLFVDAKETAHVKVVRPADLRGIAGPLTFGGLVSGGLGCKGLIDEVRISNCVRPDRADHLLSTGQAGLRAVLHPVPSGKRGIIQKGVRYRCAKHPAGRSGNGT